MSLFLDVLRERHCGDDPGGVVEVGSACARRAGRLVAEAAVVLALLAGELCGGHILAGLLEEARGADIVAVMEGGHADGGVVGAVGAAAAARHDHVDAAVGLCAALDEGDGLFDGLEILRAPRGREGPGGHGCEGGVLCAGPDAVRLLPRKHPVEPPFYGGLGARLDGAVCGLCGHGVRCDGCEQRGYCDGGFLHVYLTNIITESGVEKFIWPR